MNTKLCIPAFIVIAGLHCGYSQSFTEVSQQAGINHVTVTGIRPLLSGGAAWLDYDNDGYFDLYLTGGLTGDKLYRNNGNGGFDDVTAQAGFSALAGVETNGVVSGDIDNDGYRDLFITTSRNFHNFLFKNNGNGTFTDISIPAGIADTAESGSAAFGDYNKDGFLDLVVANWCENYLQGQQVLFKAFPNFFYLNNGDNTFTDISAAMGVDDTISCSIGVIFTDYDLDGDPDIYFANDFGNRFNNQNQLLRNDHPQNSFTDVSIPTGMNVGMNGMGIAKGDYDEDGDFDYLVTNELRDVLMQNSGNGTFANVMNGSGLEWDYALVVDTQQHFTQVRSKVSWGTAFFDYDNDTYLDLFIASGDLSFSYPRPTLDSNKLFHSNGNGTFADVTAIAGVEHHYVCRGFAHADYDKDGDLDMVVCVLDTAIGNHHTLLYRNDLPAGTWVEFNLVGMQSNKDAFGALVTVKAGGRTFLREVDGGSSHASHNASTLHFGFGNLILPGGTVDSLIIRWPSGIVDTLSGLAINNIYMVEEGGFITAWSPAVPPVVHLTGNTQVCSGVNQSFAVSSTGATSFVWGFPPSWNADSLGSSASLTPDTASGYVWVYGVNQYGNGAADSIYVTALSEPKPVITPGYELELCEGDSLQLSCSPAYAYHWSNGDSIQTIDVSDSGNYSVTVTSQYGCSNHSDVVQVSISSLPLPVLNRSGDSLMANVEDAAKYYWYRDNTLIDSTLLPYLQISISGSYSVVVLSDSGCSRQSSSIQVLISALQVLHSKTLKVFPNPAGDELYVIFSKVEDTEISICDLSGKKLFTTKQHCREFTVPVETLSSGMYYLTVRGEAFTVVPFVKK